jgi:periplasmic divalent cation tolerance protein
MQPISQDLGGDRPPDCGLVWVTTSSKAEGVAIAQAVVQQHQAACVSLWPIHSIYEWQGTMHDDEEWQLVIKTRLDRVDDLVQTIRDRHSYDLPEIIALPILAGSADYLTWIRTQAAPAPPDGAQADPSA